MIDRSDLEARVRFLGIFLLAISLLGGSWACEQKRTERVTLDSLKVPGGGLGVLLESEQPASLDQARAAVQAIGDRFAVMGVTGVEVEALPDNRVRILVPGTKWGARRFERLMLRPPRVAVDMLAPGKRFFESLRKRLPADGSVRLGRDELLPGNDKDRAAAIWYLAAQDRNRLQGFLTGVEPPARQRLALLSGPGGCAAYLVPTPPALSNVIFADVRSVEDGETGEVHLEAQLAQPAKRPFADFVRGKQHRPLAILVDGELVATPMVASRMERGEIRIDPSPLAGEKAVLKAQAQKLAALLRNDNLLLGWRTARVELTQP